MNFPLQITMEIQYQRKSNLKNVKRLQDRQNDQEESCAAS